MKGKWVMIFVCLGFVSWICVLTGCSKVEPSATVSREGFGGVQLDEASTELNLDFYFATRAEDETAQVPDGYKLMRDDRGSYLVRVEPDLTEKDIRDIELVKAGMWREGSRIPGEQHIGLHFQESAAEAFARLTEANIGKPLLIVLNGDIVFSPIIKARIPTGRIPLPLSDLTEAQRKLLLSRSAQAQPGAGGEPSIPASGQVPEIVLGTAKIIVKARFRDGTKPVSAKCLLHICMLSQMRPPMARESEGRRIVPAVVGADGDWTIYNVPEGSWTVEVSGYDFAWTYEANQSGRIELTAGEEKLVALTLLRGGSVSGRVVYADTAKPASGNSVITVGLGAKRRSTTDAEGHYIVRHVAPGRNRISAQAEGYVCGRSEEVEVKDEATVVAPDIQLRRGGWISGRVVRPKDAPSDGTLRASIEPHFHGEPPSDAVIATEWVREREDYNLHFRLGPLPPGSYTLEANLRSGGKMIAGKHWRGEVKGIQVQVGKETGDVVIEVTPASG